MANQIAGRCVLHCWRRRRRRVDQNPQCVVATATSEGFWTCRLLLGHGQHPGMHHARADVELIYISGLRDDVPPMEQRSRSSSPRGPPYRSRFYQEQSGFPETRVMVGSQESQGIRVI
jgi:hypothetical protein